MPDRDAILLKRAELHGVQISPEQDKECRALEADADKAEAARAAAFEALKVAKAIYASAQETATTARATAKARRIGYTNAAINAALAVRLERDAKRHAEALSRILAQQATLAKRTA
jgi:hypothetical protein